MDTIKQIRSDILEILFKVDDITTLEKICYELNLIFDAFTEKSNAQKKEVLPLFMKGVKQKVTLETLMSEQNYKPISVN